MIYKVQLVLSPSEAAQEQPLISYISHKLNINSKRIVYTQILKRSIDARRPAVKINLQVLVHVDTFPDELKKPAFIPLSAMNDKRVIVVGMGPAGMFAALRLLMYGIKPIVMEQGFDVHQRKLDIAAMYRNNSVNEQSNYCFGEGGAGTFSDGKLFTRASKRGDTEWFLNVLIQAGASENILIDAHPHIGSDKLPGMVQTIRQWILDNGGEVHFGSEVTSLLVNNGKCEGVVLDEKVTVKADAVILATGHSSHKIYEILERNGVKLQAKGFAMGVRMEHPQKLVNILQYHGDKYLKYLPAAEYKIVEQVQGRGVYSFCMCPGGMIVPASTQNGYTVVNGMSASHRGSPFANSGFVVEIRPEDIKENPTAMDMFHFQQQFEKSAFDAVQQGLKVPAQRMVDFIRQKISAQLPETSYIPGVVSSPMHEWLPEFISERLRCSFIQLQQRMKGFISEEAVMLGVESRTSSPVRIPRNAETFEQTEIKNLYPCGEGAGYAGGITSSAFDGIAVAEVLKEKIGK